MTASREIENYIPSETVGKLLELTAIPEQIAPYEDFFEYLDGLSVDAGKKYKDKKPMLAEQICPNLTRENLEGIFDLNEKLEQICTAINKWNC